LDVTERIAELEKFKEYLRYWQATHDDGVRSDINKRRMAIQREVLEAGCFHTVTVGPPPAIGGLIAQNIDPFAMMFDPPYGVNLMRPVMDMIDQTIGVLMAGPAEKQAEVKIDLDIQVGYAFIAMPMNSDDPQLGDVHDSIKEAARRCGIHAERVDEPHSNDRITDRMLESIRRAEYVIVDLTTSRPNVFYEAGYAQGLSKTPIYLARRASPPRHELRVRPQGLSGHFLQ
jgi:hypothetical protein